MATSTTSGRWRLVFAVIVCAAFVLALVPSADAAVRRVAAAGDDAGDCTASLCRSLAYARSQASRSDVIELAEGSYGAQAIRAGGVELRAAKGAKVTVDSLDIGSSNVTIRDVRAREVDISGSGPLSNIALIGVTSTQLY